jgi:predicted RNase H-like HicB family nuclease
MQSRDWDWISDPGVEYGKDSPVLPIVALHHSVAAICGWFVSVNELPNRVSQGATREEALAMIDEAMQSWLAVSLEDGDPIPEPRTEQECSGQFRVRVPRSLHRKLVEAAADEGVSLN